MQSDRLSILFCRATPKAVDPDILYAISGSCSINVKETCPESAIRKTKRDTVPIELHVFDAEGSWPLNVACGLELEGIPLAWISVNSTYIDKAEIPDASS